MEYLMFVCTDTEPDTDKTDAPDIEAWVEEGERRGIRKQGDQLVPQSEAKTVRVRGGELLVTDGPFAETKEWIAGYDLLELRSTGSPFVQLAGSGVAAGAASALSRALVGLRPTLFGYQYVARLTPHAQEVITAGQSAGVDELLAAQARREDEAAAGQRV